ncbi:hypothetical protein EYF80_009539 [Liparis tanakae]|uniref:Uncharacterized protein n=1 Tax=Liparis tanakae TaxID=230148 RepID=A0A4Z2IRQ2_9TELE|nr:hypothetical protein EYF80_009539 [Liparis tanakae]
MDSETEKTKGHAEKGMDEKNVDKAFAPALYRTHGSAVTRVLAAGRSAGSALALPSNALLPNPPLPAPHQHPLLLCTSQPANTLLAVSNCSEKYLSSNIFHDVDQLIAESVWCRPAYAVAENKHTFAKLSNNLRRPHGVPVDRYTCLEAPGSSIGQGTDLLMIHPTAWIRLLFLSRSPLHVRPSISFSLTLSDETLDNAIRTCHPIEWQPPQFAYIWGVRDRVANSHTSQKSTLFITC